MGESRELLESVLRRVDELKTEFPKERLDTLLDKLNHTLDFGCFTNPTAWIQHSDQLEKERDVLEKVIDLY
jgi:hypothetical protein